MIFFRLLYGNVLETKMSKCKILILMKVSSN